jgi:hypothetical protein
MRQINKFKLFTWDIKYATQTAIITHIITHIRA